MAHRSRRVDIDTRAIARAEIMRALAATGPGAMDADTRADLLRNLEHEIAVYADWLETAGSYGSDDGAAYL